MDEIDQLIEADPAATAYYAVVEMHHGRLGWLAEHIRRCNFQISPDVARKILGMLDGSDQHSRFELKAAKRSGLPSRSMDPLVTAVRNFEMALEIARRCGFKRGKLKGALHLAGEPYGLQTEAVRRAVAPFKEYALQVVAEEEALAACEREESNF